MEETGYLMKKYYSRAKNILYPLVGIEKDKMFNPSCYLYWDGEENIENFELIVFFRNTGGRFFKQYEQDVILKSKRLKACYAVEGGTVYIFDLIEWASDVAELLHGGYSKFSKLAKKTIRKYHLDTYTGKEPKKDRKYHMIFYPELYYEAVSQEDFGGTISADDLRKVGELWDKIDREKETLHITIENNCDCVDIKPIFVDT